MPGALAVAASYRASILREQRIHAALGIPWQVSDGARSYLVLLPGLPRMDDGPVVPWVSPPASSDTHESWTVAIMIAWAREFFGFTRTDVASALSTTARTLHRWSSGASTPRGHHRAQVNALQNLRAQLASAFGTPQRAMLWLQTPPGLGYTTTPLDMVRAGAITPLVHILGSLESGAFR